MIALMPAIAYAQSPGRLASPPVTPAVATTQLRILDPPAPQPLPPVSVPPAPEAIPLPPPAAVASPPPAIPPEPVNAFCLADLESLALANNPTLVSASARVDAARGRWVQVGLYPNPSIGYQGVEIGNEGRAGQQGGYLETEVITGGKLKLNRAVVNQEIAQLQNEFAAQRWRVLNDVRIEYYNALVAQRTVEIYGELLRVGEQATSTAEALLKAQEGSRVDLLQSRVEMNTARIGLVNAQNRHLAAWRRLTAVMGMPGMHLSPLAGSLDCEMAFVVWEEALGRILAQSPEIAAARSGVDRARFALRREQREPIPNYNVQMTAQHDNATTDDVVGVQATFPLPLINRNQGNIRQAEADLRAAQAEVGRVELALQQRLASAFERYANAHYQVRKYSTDILPDARKSLELVTGGYKQGEFGYLPFLTAQRTFYSTNLEYMNSQREFWAARTEIEGLLLTGSLEAGESGRASASSPSIPQPTVPPPSIFNR